MEQRLQKLLAAAGIGSRRYCEGLVDAGRVTVNGVRVSEQGTRADPAVDDIRLDGKPISKEEEHVYILLNKPLGYVTTVRDPHAKHTVMQMVQGVAERIYPVGRLDADSAGLLLMSNDGEFTERLTHPSHQVPKTYRAVVRGEVPEWAASDLRKGILLDDGMTAPANVEWVDYDTANNASIIDITIHEGRNRQVRHMFEAIGYPVLALTRMQIGPIKLTGIAPGTWRRLHPSEVKALLDQADSRPAELPQIPTERNLTPHDPVLKRETTKHYNTPPSEKRQTADPAIIEAARTLTQQLKSGATTPPIEKTKVSRPARGRQVNPRVKRNPGVD